MIDRQVVQTALARLKDAHLIDTGTAGDMRILEFETQRQGAFVRYNLHLECCWRLQDASGIITGSADHYSISEGSEGETVQDERMVGFLHRSAAKHSVVRSVTADDFGGAHIEFSSGEVLVIFPSGSRGEAWRLFEPGNDADHFVAYADRAVYE